MRRALMLCLLFAGCSGERGFRLVFSGDTFCNLQGCKCPSGPSGGLPRRATLFRSLGRGVVAVDAGGLGKDPNSHVIRDEEREQDHLRRCFSAMAKMGYVTACAGDELLPRPPAFLAAVEAETGLRLVSANLLDPNGSPLLPTYAETTAGGVRVAFVGVTGIPTPRPESAALSRRLADPEVSVSRVLGILAHDPPDVIVLLSHLGLTETRDLMLRHPEIDGCVLGHSYTLPGGQHDADGRPIYYVFFEGKRVGVVDVVVTSEGTEFRDFRRASVEKTLKRDPDILAIVEPGP